MRVCFTYPLADGLPVTVEAAVHDDGDVDDITTELNGADVDLEHPSVRGAFGAVPLHDVLADLAREEASSRADGIEDRREAMAELRAQALKEERLDMVAEARRLLGFGR